MVGDVFPHIHFKNVPKSFHVAPLLVLTRTAIGLGLGILMADKIKPSLRQAAAITLLAIGALAAAPWLVKITIGQINRPETEWGSRARLRSIRGDSGYSSDSRHSTSRCRGSRRRARARPAARPLQFKDSLQSLAQRRC